MDVLEAAATFLQKVKFKHSLIGVNEKDVWKKIRTLDDMYREALERQKLEYEQLLSEREYWLRQAGVVFPEREQPDSEQPEREQPDSAHKPSDKELSQAVKKQPLYRNEQPLPEGEQK